MNYKKQVSVDDLMGVCNDHPITCPFINPLIFNGPMSSRNYEIALDFDPSSLKVNVNPLKKAIEGLEKWAEDLSRLYREQASESKPELSKAYNDNIEKLASQQFDEDINSYASEINGVIESWIEQRSLFAEQKKALLTAIDELENYEKSYLLKKINHTLSNDDSDLLDFYRNEVEEAQEKLEDIEDDFNRHIKEDFKKTTEEFSTFLEVVRERNDTLRELVDDLKYGLLTYCKKELDLYQPDEYLDLKFGTYDKIPTDILNLGVLYSSRNEQRNFTTLIQGIRAKQAITFDQMLTLMDASLDVSSDAKEKRETLLFNILDKNGFKKIRYYESADQYIKDKDSYIERNCPLKIEKKYKASL